jgi:hypothetical protein
VSIGGRKIVTVTSPRNYSTPLQLELISASGRIVYSAVSAKPVFAIPRTITSGVYIAAVTSNGNIIARQSVIVDR